MTQPNPNTPAKTSNVHTIVRLLRPQQWIKNLIVLLPVFFGGELGSMYAIINGLIAALSFSFAASSIYCLNDLVDVDDDRRHPVKRHRPIASGEVSIRTAWFLVVLMIVLSIGSLQMLNGAQESTSGIILFYWLLNIAYCLWLKQYAIIDVCVVAFGFVLRLLAGGMATYIVLSKWIMLMTFLLMLFLAFAKRRDDVVRMEATGEAPRKNTIRYNLTFINQAITITASVTLICYVMFTISPEMEARYHSDYLYLTSIFVLLGLLRYIQITVVDKRSGDPTKVILHDTFTQLVVAAWGITYLMMIYCR